MDIVEEAFHGLYPGRPYTYASSVKYSWQLKDYNSNIRFSGSNLAFHLNKKWRKVDKEIRLGLIQSLLSQIFKTRRRTIEMEYYSSFIKHLHLAVPKTNVDERLAEVFGQLNEQYFNGMLEMPNLALGNSTTSKLGSYEYARDLITISSILADHPKLLEYVLFHEMLHKKYKFSSKGERTIHHPPEFLAEEKKFPNAQQLEQELSRVARKAKGWSWLIGART